MNRKWKKTGRSRSNISPKGANVNHLYPLTRQPEFSNFAFYRIEHLIAMLEAGANPNAADRSGNTPLMNSLNFIRLTKSTVKNEMLENFKMVLRYGANPNARNRRGQTVLSFARRTGDKDLIELLRKAGARDQ